MIRHRHAPGEDSRDDGAVLAAAAARIVAPRAAAYAALVARVQACRRCLRMEDRTRVLGAANGPLGARVLFVGEAPGRLGGDRTAVPFQGDQSGATFARLLTAAGLARDAVFVTNAVLCNPRDEGGRNAKPTAAELRACADHLDAQLALVDPAWVVALGQTALHALARLAPHGLRLRADVGRPVDWRGRRLVALYHPGPRALIRRPLAAQLADYERLGCLVRGEQDARATDATASAIPDARPA